MNRRRFLLSTASVPFIFGLEELTTGALEPDPSWWKAGFKEMKSSLRPGVVVVLPDSELERSALGDLLWEVLQDATLTTRELFVGSVFLCAPGNVAAKSGDTEASMLLLHDADGTRIDERSYDIKTFRKEFVPTLQKLLQGEDGKNRIASVNRVKAGIGERSAEQLGEAFAGLALEADEAKPHGELLRKHQAVLGAWIVAARWTSNSPVAAKNLEALLREHPSGKAAPLPHGTYLPKEKDLMPAPCPACGMALPRDKSRKFLRFLVQ